ncbi:hypothetical protein WI75_13835 [Burkholderia ubonensis]|nr:hypothetical protein WI75_13835 [Burkholderia ubonensis]
MVNSLVELVVVSGSYGWQPMRPALFAVLLCSVFPPRPLVERDDSSNRLCNRVFAPHSVLEKNGFQNRFDYGFLAIGQIAQSIKQRPEFFIRTIVAIVE